MSTVEKTTETPKKKPSAMFLFFLGLATILTSPLWVTVMVMVIFVVLMVEFILASFIRPLVKIGSKVYGEFQ